MSNSMALVFLVLSAILEAGGDAIVRTSLFANKPLTRILLLILGGLVLTAYGYAVNAPRWDFGKLLGVYVCLFFIAAQAISWISFKQPPSVHTLIGGALIIAGGLVVFTGK